MSNYTFLFCALQLALCTCAFTISDHHFILFFPRKNYEESMMVRLNMPKHQKNSKKRGAMSMSGMLSGITHFGDISALTGGEGGQVSLQRHRQRGHTSLTERGWNTADGEKMCVEGYLMGVSLRWGGRLWSKSRGWPDYLLWLLSHLGSHQQTAKC